MTSSREADPYGWHHERRDLLRAVAGGAIVGMPLLYTMEMWQHGMLVSEWHLLALLTAILIVNFLFSLLSGFRERYSVRVAISESITAVGIALFFSAAILALIGELPRDLSRAEVFGKILLEAAAVSIGVSFANAQIQGKSRTGDNQEEPEEKPTLEESDARQLRKDLRDFVAAIAGSTVFALNVAPTEEITLIAGRLSPLRLLLMLGASVALCYIILFAAEFREHKVHLATPFQSRWAETGLTSATSLVVAAVLLLLLGESDLLQHPSTAAASIVTLGLPAIVGGAAGRLII